MVMPLSPNKLLEVYRISTSPEEISEVLGLAKAKKQSMLWQNRSSHKVFFHFDIVELDISNKKITVNYNGSSELIDPTLPIFVKLHFRETLFKGMVLDFDTNKLSINIPNEIHVREYRNSLRIGFFQDEEIAEVKSLVSGGVENSPSLNVSLRDISKKGLGLLVSSKNIHLFSPGQVIIFSGCSKVKLKTPLTGKVVYKIEYSKKSSGISYKVGVELDEMIPEEKFEKFVSSKRQLFQTTSKSLLSNNIFPEDFKNDFNLEFDRILTKFRNRNAIQKYIELIEAPTTTDFYLVEHIKVLTIVCTYIARAMNWASDISLEKFIYLAYIHDAPLFQYPRLTRIRDKKDFFKMKPQLFENEQKIFFLAPEKASSIAIADNAAPPDVHQILALQKELPHGDGFPNGINYKKIPPMAALFIIAHDLTDEILLNYDWSIERWLLKVKDKYNTGNFEKILEGIMNSKEKIRANLKKM
jgi:hypothetical protein